MTTRKGKRHQGIEAAIREDAQGQQVLTTAERASSTKLAKIEALAKIFTKAKEAAKAADPGVGADGGTCNFDSPALFPTPAFNSSVIEAAAAKAGIQAMDFTWFKKKCFWIDVDPNGQANRRTVMAEAACKVLKEAGLDAMMYYQMD